MKPSLSDISAVVFLQHDFLSLHLDVLSLQLSHLHSNQKLSLNQFRRVHFKCKQTRRPGLSITILIFKQHFKRTAPTLILNSSRLKVFFFLSYLVNDSCQSVVESLHFLPKLLIKSWNFFQFRKKLASPLCLSSQWRFPVLHDDLAECLRQSSRGPGSQMALSLQRFTAPSRFLSLLVRLEAL